MYAADHCDMELRPCAGAREGFTMRKIDEIQELKSRDEKVGFVAKSVKFLLSMI